MISFDTRITNPYECANRKEIDSYIRTRPVVSEVEPFVYSYISEAMKIYKPTSPGRRQMTKASAGHLRKKGPMKNLLKRVKKQAGRNSAGRITTRHKGGGHKKLYRMVDFKQKKMDVQGKIEAIEYDPYRTAHIARVLYENGSRAYVLALDRQKKGDIIVTSEKAEQKEGVRTVLEKIPTGTFVHNVELSPQKGGVLARSAGSSIQVLGNEGKYTHLKMPSGETRKVLGKGLATIGKVSNSEHNLEVIGKAGRSRWKGIRPTVRGSAMNPVDHPYGGGEGRTQRGTKRPKTKWGKVTGGRRTRKKNRRSNKLIITRRKSKRNK